LKLIKFVYTGSDDEDGKIINEIIIILGILAIMLIKINT